jgi:hypothetical protein
MKKTITFIALLFSCVLSAQNKSFSLYHIQASHGGFSDYNSFSGQETFGKLAPESELLQREYTGKTYTPNTIYIRQGALSAGFINRSHLESSRRFVPVWQLGVSYQYGVFADHNNLLETITPIDSGIPPDGDQSVATDSVNRKNLGVAYTSNLLMLNIGLVWQQANREKRWQWYGGLRISGGLMFSSVMETGYSEDHILVYHESPDRQVNVFGGTDHLETEKNPASDGFALQAMLPVGVSLRLGNKDSFFWKFQLFGEISPMAQYIKTENLPGRIHYGYGMFAGIRYLL